MKYANQRGYPFAIIVGEEEQKTGLLTVKDMKSGEQLQLSVAELINKWQ